MLALIVAYANNRVIGRDGKIPWNIPGEQRRFRELTTGNIVVMGRRTFAEIGRPLPDRITIVVSKSLADGASRQTDDNLLFAGSLEEALFLARDRERDIFISGGARLYEDSLELVEKMYITEIEADVEGDTFFPEFDEKKFTKEIVEHVEGEIPYTYVTYLKKVFR